MRGKQKERFVVDSNILYPIILKQAGTLEKAFLELIMNSIDAGATEIRLKFDGNEFSIEDNGKGFENEANIENFFKTFGKPHEDGDSVYGKFRMGRGQIMAFTKNTWYSNNFRMEVDIKTFMGYDFSTTNEYIDGCKITGTLYEPLEASNIIKFNQELKSLIRFSQIPVYLNDELISDEIDNIVWDMETDFAYIKFDNKRNLEVYNLGVKVRDYSSWFIGTGGIVVSKKQLDVNFARNDILTSKCEIWKEIEKVIDKKLNEKIKKSIKKNSDLTDEEISVYSKKLITGELSYWNARKVKIFVDIKGKKYSLLQVLKNEVIAISSKDSLLGDKVYERNYAFVLDNIILENFGFKTLNTLIDSLLDYIKRSYADIYNSDDYNVKEKKVVRDDHGIIEKDRTIIDDISYYENTIDTQHTIIDSKKLHLKERLCLQVLNEFESEIRDLIDYNCTPKRRKRQIVAGKSKLSNGWTDGKTYIAIQEDKLEKARKGVIGFMYLCALLIHEYLHSGLDNKTHTHNEMFYNIFHNIIMTSFKYDSSLGHIIFRMAKKYSNLYEKHGIRIPVTYLCVPNSIYNELTKKDSFVEHDDELIEDYIPDEVDTELLN